MTQATQTQTLADFLLARYDEEEERFDLAADDAGRLPWPLVRAHVLADLAAKRRIVELHSAQHSCAPDDFENDANSEPWFEAADRMPPYVLPCATLRALAAPYADCADFREEWR